MALVTVAGLCESSVLLFKGKVAWYMFNIYGIFKDTFFFVKMVLVSFLFCHSLVYDGVDSINNMNLVTLFYSKRG